MKKFTFWILVIILALCSAVGAILYHASSLDYYYEDIEKLVLAETGYTIEKSGSSELSLFPEPELSYNQVVVTNPASSSHPDLGNVTRLSFKLKVQPLLQGRVVVDVDIDSMSLDLHIDHDGSQNWMTEELQLITTGLPFDLGRVNASKTQFLLNNHAEKEILELDLEHFFVDLTLGEARAEINSSGSIKDSEFLASGRAGFDIEKKELDLDIEFAATLSGNIPDIDLRKSPGTTWYEEFSSHYPMQGQIQGSITVEEDNVYGELAVTSNIQNLEKLIPLPPDFPVLQGNIGPINSSGIIQINGFTVDLDVAQVLLENDQITLEATGELGNLLDNLNFNL